MPLCEAIELSKSFGRRPLFAGSVAVEVGDRPVRLVGANGVGKSTFLRMLAGLDVTYRGRLTWDGVDAAHRLDVALVPETGLLFPNLTLVEQRRWIRRRSRGAEPWWPADHLDLEGLGSLYPFEMSTGQRRKATIAVALSVEASLVLFDESWLGLDVASKARVDDLVTALVDDGRAVMFVSHEDRAFDADEVDFESLWETSGADPEDEDDIEDE